ncbi:MAG: hypothetical protein U1F58_02635 [Burkholderiales bacterium]
MTVVVTATASGALGLYPATAFRVTTGGDRDAPAIPQALWYFRGETIAVPRPGLHVAGFARGTDTFADVRAWAAAWREGTPPDYPPLVWIAAPDVLRGARLLPDRDALAAGGSEFAYTLVPKIPLNRSYFDATSRAYFAARAVTARGTADSAGFAVRTLWPDEFRLGGAAPPARALPAAPSPAAAMRALMREAPRGGAASPFAAWTLWQRAGVAADWTGRPVLALMVNGAQGDDDEAHAGHFALVTGRVAADGAIGDWLVSNFYTLDTESEKGIVAAPVPLDNYLADLNSGQAWYRPSCLLVAVLRDERAAALVQGALNRVYNQFYRHQLDYYHPTQNCTSISVDTLRTLGWPVPARGATSAVGAWLAYPFVALAQRSLAKAATTFDYQRTDLTRLLPAVALEDAFASLWALVHGERPKGDGTLARMLAGDVEALAYLRVPQLPSSRTWGDAPAVSLAEYRARVPRDPAKVQAVPVPPRPFPVALRDPDLLPRAARPSDRALAAWAAASLVGLPYLLWRAWRRRRARGR